MESEVVKFPNRAAHTKVRDRREYGFFYVDNEIIDQPGARYSTVTIYGLAVYAVLCRYAQSKSECKVLLETIAKAARTSRASVSRGIGELEAAGLISVERTKKHSSVYTLLKVEKIQSKTAENEFPIETHFGNEFPIRTQTENEFPIATRNKTEDLNKTKTLPASQEVVVKTKKKTVVDSRTQPFIRIIQEVHKSKTGRHYPWEGRQGHHLKHFLFANEDFTETEFRQCLQNYWSSENTNPSEPPTTYLGKLEKYRDGPLNLYGKPIHKQTPHNEDDFESPAVKTRRQLQGGR